MKYTLWLFKVSFVDTCTNGLVELSVKDGGRGSSSLVVGQNVLFDRWTALWGRKVSKMHGEITRPQK